MDEQILGYVWPKKTRCPECQSKEWENAGTSRGGRIQYRRCECGVVYKALPIAEHVDRGGDQSDIRQIS